jgi:hypothetical protein
VQHEDFTHWASCLKGSEAAQACGGAEQLEVDKQEFRLVMWRQLRKFALRRLADAARFDHATGEARAMLTATKLSTLDLDTVRSDVAALRTDMQSMMQTLEKSVGALQLQLGRQEEALSRIERAERRGLAEPDSACLSWPRRMQARSRSSEHHSGDVLDYDGSRPSSPGP